MRGIGVAVITSTSGCTPFCSKLETLHYAEAMLLVDDHQAQLLELDVFLEQRMGPDHHVDQPFRDQFLQLTFLFPVFEPVSRIGTYPILLSSGFSEK